MIQIPRRVLFSIAALLFMLLMLNLWLQRNRSLESSSTSYGVGPSGYKAAFDLLHELGVPITRSYFRSNRVSHSRVMWFIMPDFLDREEERTRTDTGDLMRW